MAVVEVGGLCKKFDQVNALKNVNLTVDKNEIFGIIGPDGAGKTTLLRILAGVLRFDSGSIMVCGQDILRKPEAIKDKIGVMPQVFSLYPDLSVEENLMFFARMYNVLGEALRVRVDRLLDITELKPFLKRRAEHLSGGMQKKLALITSLLHTPQLLLLDEPTTGIDPISRRELWDFFYDLLKSGTTIVVSTPYMDEAERCTNVGFLYRGELLLVDKPDKMKDNYGFTVLEVTGIKRKQLNFKDYPLKLGITDMYMIGDTAHVICDKMTGDSAARFFEAQGLAVKKIEPAFEDVFISQIRARGEIPDEKH